MQTLDRNHQNPLYQQIKQVIRHNIDQNIWQPNQQLPSENALVKSLNVSRMTINRALRELTQEGLLRRVHGLGTFVAPPKRHASLITLQNIADEIQAAGYTHHSKVLSLTTTPANKIQATNMQVKPNTPLYHLRAIHYQDTTPIQLEDRLINPAIVPNFKQIDFTQQTATGYLISQLKPDQMEHTVQAITPTKRTTTHLKLQPHTPCLRLTRRTWKDNTIITHVTLTYPGDRYQLSERYKTEQYSNNTFKHSN